MHRRFFALIRLALTLGAVALAACSNIAPRADASVDRRLMALMPADAVLLGEQHDAPEHQAIEREAVEALARRGRLAAVAIEMAEEGNSAAHLPPDATEAQVQIALGWNDKAWPWTAYGPVVMAAVRAGVPVVGANLPRERMKDAMSDVSLDAQLTPDALAEQQEAVRVGHCNLLPEARIVPMTRIQIARDRAMAQAIVKARVPGKTVLLVSGAGHAARMLGVPRHLPSDMATKVVELHPGQGGPGGSSDAVWPTSPVPEKDYCLALRPPSRP